MRYEIDNQSMVKVTLMIKETVPLTTNPLLPPGEREIQPEGMSLSLWFEEGLWVVSVVNVWGKAVLKGGTMSKRDYETPFMNPFDGHAGAPQWLLDTIREFLKDTFLPGTYAA